MKSSSLIIFFVFFFYAGSALSQVTYNMSNMQVEDCEGILLDSDANDGAPGNYDHNEHFVFSICPPGGDSIFFTFLDFGTEPNYDVLKIYDSPDTNSPLIGSFSGTSNPGSFIALSGCITLKFTSDADLSDIGWIAEWRTVLKEPVPPKITAVSGASCFANTLRIDFDKDIPCDSLFPSYFTISGPGPVTVAAVSPNPCNNGFTRSVVLTLNPSFSDNGNYAIVYRYRFTDICGNLWEFDIPATATVSDCPLTAEILASSDTICRGDCVTLTGTASGGDAASYQFQWNNGIPAGAGPHTVCPLTTTTYQLTVSDNSPSPSDVASKTIVVIPRPNAGSNRSICRFDAPITLNGSPAGGFWSGSGISDTNAGIFDPDSGIIGINKVWYTVNGCADTIEVEVLFAWAGPTQAACPGSPAFQVTGGYPIGGTWSGPNITSNGIFDPASPGSYTVTYTAPNGCQHSKSIHVDTIIMASADTACTSLNSYYLSASPAGGVWSGTGIVNGSTGEFNPNAAGSGTHTITYTLKGCSKTMEVYVQQINARWNRVYCPSQGLDTLAQAIPSGGYWTGNGIVDSVVGSYNPAWNNGKNYNDYVVYHLQGCTDTIIVYGRITRIYNDTLFFCQSDTFLRLDWKGIRRTPGNGQWSGPGITDPDYPGIFDPKVAGAGTHTLVYDANTCVDSVVMVVYPLPSFQPDTTVCTKAASFALDVSPPGGVWNGYGIVDSNAGIFDPQITGTGSFTLRYTSTKGCRDSMQVTVEPLQNISIDPVASFFCYADTMVILRASPQGGTFSGPGISDSIFNPLQADSGMHVIYYDYGSGECAVKDSFTVRVGAPLWAQISMAADSICFGDVSRFRARAGGGLGSNYRYQWSHGLGTKDSVIVNPSVSTSYTVTVSDGCTEEAAAGIYVHVYPEIVTSYSSGPKVCYGIKSFVAASGNGNYRFEWQTEPPYQGDTLKAEAGDYWVTVRDLNSGCTITETASIEGYPYIKASFSVNPDAPCTNILNPELSIIDRSVGGVTGTFSFGDGTTFSYSPGIFLDHSYADTGTYRLYLRIENEGGCADSSELSFCVEPAATLYLPSGFTPNNDGLNDYFRAKGIGIVEFHMAVFNRWGEKLFESDDIDQGWDGIYQGRMSPNDAYTYLVIYRDMTSSEMKKKKGTFALIR